MKQQISGVIVDLHSCEKFWPLKNGLIRDFPSLNQNLKADVVIMGAGVSGALAAHALCQSGEDVIILDKRHSGQGSTSASTALLQYEIDTPLVELSKKIGEDKAARSYHLCIKAIHDLQHISQKLMIKPHFQYKPSLQYASVASHVPRLKKEIELRKKHGISSIEWLGPSDIKKKYGFTKPAGILSADGAEIDPFRLTYGLMEEHLQKNLRVFDNTKVAKIIHHRKSVEVKTENGFTINAKKLVIACGYESQNYLTQKVEERHSTYVILSEVMKHKKFWHRNSLIWETASPYLYIRTTADNRILIGGKDDNFYNPEKRDAKLPSKARQLQAAFSTLFPQIPFNIDYQWAGTFCETKDGLPFIGSIRERPNTYFALGFGGNGILFSVLAAQMITEMLHGKKNQDHKFFSFHR